MSGSRRFGSFAAITAALLLAACSDGGGGATVGSDSAAGTSTAGATVGVTVTSDVQYMPDADGYQPALMDVYTPDGATDAPLVVLLHGGAETKTTLMYPDLANAVAATGAVVVVPNWGATAPPEQGPGAAAEMARTVQRAGCAVGYAVAHGEEWGANTEQVTLFGHSLGANVASVLALEPEQDLSGCAPEATTWAPYGAVLVDGDFAMMDPSLWDAYGADLADMFPVMTPWSYLSDPSRGTLHFFASSSFREEATRCGDLSTWAVQRTPDGHLAGMLEDADENGDGCLDVGEVEMALDDWLSFAGISADYAELSGQGTTHRQWSADDLQRVVGAITSITSAPGTES